MMLAEYIVLFVLVATTGAGLPGRVTRRSLPRGRWQERAG